MDSKYKWNFEDLYESNNQFEKDINRIYELLNEIEFSFI